MNVLFDHQTFTLQEYGGISRYFFELIKRFHGDPGCRISIKYSNNAYLNKSSYSGVSDFFRGKEFRGKSRVMNFVNEFVSKRELERSDFDVFHPTYYNPYFLDKINRRPFVITCLDMIHEKYGPRFSELKVELNQKKKIVLERADRIIAISQTTKRDIMEIFKISGENIDVVYLGNSLENNAIGSTRLIERDYILFVGKRTDYKNFSFLIKSIAPLLLKHDLILVGAGGGEFSPEELQLIQALGLEERVVFARIVDDGILANLYAHAVCFVFPSLYEGFGIPVLESFACGCPVLLSTGGALPEVGGDAACYFDPTEPESVHAAFSELVESPSRRRELVLKGSARLQEFSWDRTFNETLNVYRSVL